MAITASPTGDTTVRGGTWIPTTPAYPHGPQLSFPGEPTPAPGLAIVPGVNAYTGRYTGGWTVIHTQSGLHPALPSIPLVYAREAAALLAGTGLDWTSPMRELLNPHTEETRAVWDIHTRVHEAWNAGRPAWWARHSWQHIPPAWLVTTVDIDGDDYQLDTWRDLVAWLNSHLGDPWYRVERITREPDATWRLVCAAPLCDNHPDTIGAPAVLADEDDHSGECFDIRHPARGTVAQAARDRGWTRHDLTHWTCPACTAEHTRNPDVEYGC